MGHIGNEKVPLVLAALTGQASYKVRRLIYNSFVYLIIRNILHIVNKKSLTNDKKV